MSTSPTAVEIVFGAMTVGDPGYDVSRIDNVDSLQAILDVFKSYGHSEIDTARAYNGGTSESLLAKVGAERQGFKIATKIFPNARSLVPAGANPDSYTLEAADVARSLDQSLKALETQNCDLFYLHSPDRQTPIAETLGAIDKAYKAGHFERFGISNFRADEVEELVQVAKENGYVLPTVYQGLYNAVARRAEPELLPVLRKHNISYYVFSPLGGGFFTGNIKKDTEIEKGTRFDPDSRPGKIYRGRYWKDCYFQAFDEIRVAAERHNFTLAEVSLRWLVHHSVLKREYGDAIIIGASSTKQLEQNLVDLTKEPLPQDVVDAVNKGWELVKDEAPAYHH